MPIRSLLGRIAMEAAVRTAADEFRKLLKKDRRGADRVGPDYEKRAKRTEKRLKEASGAEEARLQTLLGRYRGARFERAIRVGDEAASHREWHDAKTAYKEAEKLAGEDTKARATARLEWLAEAEEKQGARDKELVALGRAFEDSELVSRFAVVAFEHPEDGRLRAHPEGCAWLWTHPAPLFEDGTTATCDALDEAGLSWALECLGKEKALRVEAHALKSLAAIARADWKPRALGFEGSIADGIEALEEIQGLSLPDGHTLRAPIDNDRYAMATLRGEGCQGEGDRGWSDGAATLMGGYGAISAAIEKGRAVIIDHEGEAQGYARWSADEEGAGSFEVVLSPELQGAGYLRPLVRIALDGLRSLSVKRYGAITNHPAMLKVAVELGAEAKAMVWDRTSPYELGHFTAFYGSLG